MTFVLLLLSVCLLRQFLPALETHNVLLLPHPLALAHHQSQLRRQFYLAQLMSEDEETQKKGIVVIYITNGKRTAEFDTVYAYKAAVCSRSVPVRVEAFHFSFDDTKSGWRPVFDTVKVAINPFSRVRIKTHFGGYTECMYALQTFGIPSQEFPLKVDPHTGDVVIDTQEHVQRMEKRRERERRVRASWTAQQACQQGMGGLHHPSFHNSFSSNVSISTPDEDKMEKNYAVSTTSGSDVDNIIDDNSRPSTSPPPLSCPAVLPDCVGVPSKKDVLFGRGKSIQNHMGNQRYRQLIEDSYSLYEASKKDQKTHIAEEVIRIIHGSGGRFLRDDGATGWVRVADSNMLRKKVAHAFRGLRFLKEVKAVRDDVVGPQQRKPKNKTTTSKPSPTTIAKNTTAKTAAKGKKTNHSTDKSTSHQRSRQESESDEDSILFATTAAADANHNGLSRKRTKS